MENNENFVQETENVEQPTEEAVAVKTFTQEEMNAAVGKAKARERAKVEKEYKRKYSDLEEVLKAGTGKNSVGEITDTFRAHYEKRGIPMPKKPEYSTEDIQVLANADAAELIRSGFEEVVEEADRLKEKGAENMTAREKAVFIALTNHIKDTETSRELSSIGVTKDVYESDGKTHTQKEFKTAGSMKNTPTPESGVKEFYSVEEARKFTKADFDKNPDLFAAIQRSMLKWK